MNYMACLGIVGEKNEDEELISAFTSYDRNRALYQFVRFSNKLDKVMRDIEESGKRDDIEHLAIFAGFYEDGIMVNGDILSYQEYRAAMDAE